MHINSLHQEEPYKKEENIEKVSFTDSQAKRFFETQKPYEAFEDSWFALIQGIRHKPQLYKRKVYFSDHPYEVNSLIVYNHLCKNYFEFTHLLNSLLIELGKNKAVWKNANLQDLPILFHHGFQCYKEKERWDSISKYDDQTYPQYVCSLKQIALLNGPKLGQIRQQVRAVERAYNHDLIFEKYKKEYENECKSLVINISEEISTGKDLSTITIAHANLLYLTCPPEHSFIIRYKEKIISFIAFDVRENTANFNCMVYKRSPKYISTYTMVKAAQELYKNGVEKVNLSGSELKSLDHWKNKFNPIKKIERIHLILVRKRKNNELELPFCR